MTCPIWFPPLPNPVPSSPNATVRHIFQSALDVAPEELLQPLQPWVLQEMPASQPELRHRGLLQAARHEPGWPARHRLDEKVALQLQGVSKPTAKSNGRMPNKGRYGYIYTKANTCSNIPSIGNMQANEAILGKPTATANLVAGSMLWGHGQNAWQACQAFCLGDACLAPTSLLNCF